MALDGDVGTGAGFGSPPLLETCSMKWIGAIDPRVDDVDGRRRTKTRRKRCPADVIIVLSEGRRGKEGKQYMDPGFYD